MVLLFKPFDPIARKREDACCCTLDGKMRISSVTTLLLALGGAHAQLQYGNNERDTIKDSEAVANAFPEVEGFELLSPAFLKPESTPPGWENGTAGPTSLAEMGMATPNAFMMHV